MDPVGGHLRRHLGNRIRDALGGFRVVVLHGARQTGKTTLARLISEESGGTYVTLEDEPTLRAAVDDPAAFLTSWPTPLVVDEVQAAGDRLIRVIKRLVDEDQTPGRFLLTGSTNFLTVPTISESLAGRARILRLAPLSQAEIAGAEATPIDAWTARACRPDRGRGPEAPEPLTRRDYAELICRGGYPEVLRLPPGLRSGWFESYVDTVVGRDIVALADIRRSTALEPLLRWTAAQTSQGVNLASASRRLGISHPTVIAYLDWLRTVFLVRELPAWSRNLTSRAVRRPKLHVTDTGLAAGLLDIDPDALALTTSPAMGALAESFAVNEIARQATSARARTSLWHYRDAQREVDLILEQPDGSVVAVEVKASSSPSPDGLRHLRWLRDRLDAVAPGCFTAGVLLHMGRHQVSVGDRLRMWPLSSLWTP
ncbi:MAG: ATP-binding protein [Acidimicrobiaceae bacterium]|nr:ATP-binding protein [Acidimicrobiaceae bacterium]